MTFCCKDGHSYTIAKGERFAQLIIEQANYYVGEEVEEFTRSFGQAHEGYGSTGK
jgi:dUTPase